MTGCHGQKQTDQRDIICKVICRKVIYLKGTRKPQQRRKKTDKLKETFLLLLKGPYQ